MQTRRSFIRTASLLTAGAAFQPNAFGASRHAIGLQLYTVRDAMQKDVASTLARVAELGFSAVEGATYSGSQDFYGLKPSAFKALLRQHRLVMPSNHYRLGMEKPDEQEMQGTLLHQWDKAVDDAAAVGISYMVCAYLSPEERGGIDGYKRLAEQLNRAGERCRQAGILLCYHNHDFEFEPMDGLLPYDVLLSQTDSSLVKMELDLYWVHKAGKDPLALFAQHPGRFPLWHVKDMDNTPQKGFTEVGSGVIDFKSVFLKARQAGMKHFFVEQDHTPASPFDSIRKSITYIKKNII